MDRGPLQLVLALALVTSLLGVSTALVAEVREEILAAQEASSEITFTPPEDGSRGLPISEFTLLDPAPIDLRATDRAGNVIHLSQPATLQLSTGDRLEVSPVPLGTPAQVELTSPATYENSRLVCHDGCLVYGPQGRLVAPPNTTLLLPGATTLPVEAGELDRGQRFDLPQGTKAALSTITIDRPTPLPLATGSTLILPSGQHGIPQDPSYAEHTLPAGTLIRGDKGSGPDTSQLLERATQGPAASTTVPLPDPPGRPTIEVTEVPASIKKGKPFTVKGTVVTPDGGPSVHHPVTLYANASKQAPGFEIQIGQVRTDGTGTFETLARIDESRPTQPYHIVARAHPRVDTDPTMTEAWSDPVVDVEGRPSLEIEMPDEEGRAVPLTLRATLTDEFGAPVPDQRIRFKVEGTSRPIISALTDDQGQAVTVLHDGLPNVGTWNISARFDGASHLDPAQDFHHLEIIEARIITDPTILVPRGSTATLNGEVRLEDGAAARTGVTATYAGVEANTTTRPDGTFQLHFSVPESLKVGNYTMRLETEDLSATRSVIVTVTGRTELHATPPPVAPLGGTLPLRVTVTDELGTALPVAEVTARTASGREAKALTDEDGQAIVPVPLASLGSWDLKLSTDGTPLHAGNTTALAMLVGEVRTFGELKLVPGQVRNTSLGVTIANQPVPDEPVALHLPGTTVRGLTDHRGRLATAIEAPTSLATGAQEATLTLTRYNVDHRFTARILEVPDLSVEVLEDGQEGQDLKLKVQATGQAGPLAQLPLTVLVDGAFEAEGRTHTDSQGQATFTFDRPRDAEGLAVVRVHAEETGTTGPSVQVASAKVTPAPVPWLWILAPVGLVALGWIVYRARQSSEQAPLPTGPILSLSIDPQEGNLPPVWHAQAPTTLNLQLTTRQGDPIPGVEVRVQGPAGRARVTLDDQGQASLPVPASTGDLMSFHAEFDGDAHHRPAESTLDVRLVDYQEEIDREYRELREAAAHQGRCGTDATPHELARAYGSQQARRLARLFERCDYSPHPVGRGDYEAFMKAKRALRDDGGEPIS